MTYPDWDADNHPEVLWPPADADTLLVLKVAGDTRPGWLRFTWIGEEVTIQGTSSMISEVPMTLAVKDRDAMLAWGVQRGYPSVLPSWE